MMLNQYALATAHLNDAPIDLQILIGQPDSETNEAVFQQRATLVRYEVAV